MHCNTTVPYKKWLTQAVVGKVDFLLVCSRGGVMWKKDVDAHQTAATAKCVAMSTT